MNKLVLSQGAIDFGENMPAHDVHLIARQLNLSPAMIASGSF